MKFVSNVATRARSAFNNARGILGTAAAVAMASAPGLALAQAPATLGDAATSELATAKTVITGLLITLVGIVFVFVVYSLIKRAK